MDTTGACSDFDLQLEHGNDLISLETSGFFLAFENTGDLLLERDIGGEVGDKLIEETKWKDKLEFSYIGNTSKDYPLKNSVIIEPLSGSSLASKLSENDIYLVILR